MINISIYNIDVGDTVSVDEVVCEVETDKVNKQLTYNNKINK